MMLFGWFDMLFSFLFPILFLIFIGVFIWMLSRNIRT